MKKSGKPAFTLGPTSHEVTTFVLVKRGTWSDGSQWTFKSRVCKVDEIERKREKERERQRERVMHPQVPDDAHAGDKYRGVNASRCHYGKYARAGKKTGGKGMRGGKGGRGRKVQRILI